MKAELKETRLSNLPLTFQYHLVRFPQSLKEASCAHGRQGDMSNEKV